MPLLLLFLVSCIPHRIVRLEKSLLALENASLEEQLETCGRQPEGADFVPRVTPEALADFIGRAGLAEAEQAEPGVFLIPIDGSNTDFRIVVQLIEEAQVLFIGTLDYFELDAVASSPAMVVLLTQLSSLNYELLTGKFQLNVQTGDVALSVEQRVGAGLSFGTFDEMVWHLVRTADEHHPMLEAIAAGTLH